MKTDFEFIMFRDASEYVTGKTKAWVCLNGRSGGALGSVRWHGPWRQHCFFPTDAVFSAGCLRDIAEFLDSVRLARNAGDASDARGGGGGG